MPRKRYEQIIGFTEGGKKIRAPEGAWVMPARKGFRFICCDCGLSHILGFRVVKGRVQMSVQGDRRSTAARRRRARYARIKKALARGV